MGNRAQVMFVENCEPTELNPYGIKEYSPVIYLHWNGGPESVYAFLAELDRRHVRADRYYEAARFVQVVGDFFDSGKCLTSLSLGIDTLHILCEETLKGLSQCDNGLYMVERSTHPFKIKKMRRIREGVEWDTVQITNERDKIDPEFLNKVHESFLKITNNKEMER